MLFHGRVTRRRARRKDRKEKIAKKGKASSERHGFKLSNDRHRTGVLVALAVVSLWESTLQLIVRLAFAARRSSKRGMLPRMDCVRTSQFNPSRPLETSLGVRTEELLAVRKVTGSQQSQDQE